MLTPAQPVASRANDQRAGSPLVRYGDRLLDGAVVVLCTWTVVYHLCLLLRLSVPWAIGLEVLALAGWFLVARRMRSRRGAVRASEPSEPTDAPGSAEGTTSQVPPRGRADVGLIALTAASAAGAALLMGINRPWPVIAGLWLTAAVTGTVFAARRYHRSPVPVDPEHGPVAGRPTRTNLGALLALGWALALAVLSVFTIWPNPDDLYYVNLAQAVVDYGAFPLRDTIFSDLGYPMSSWPPVASYDALAGTLAWITGVHAASVVYIVVPPVATFLSVLALWRLLGTWRVRAVGVALSLALVFLLFDGGAGYAAPGNLFLIRIWQGKVILLCLLVPILLVYALRYVDRPSRARAGWLFAGGVAATGLSTSAMFLVPLLAVGGAAPLVSRRPRQALLGFVAMSAYPLAAGVATLLVGGRSADLFDTRELHRFDPSWFGPEIFRTGPLAVIAVLAVLTGALLVPHRAARVTTGVLVFITGVTFIPGFTEFAYDLVGLGPTLWRVSWVATIAALVGVLGARLATYWRSRVVFVAIPVGLAAVMAVSGLPIWSPANGVALEWPPQWKRGAGSVASAQMAVEAAQPGDLILAHQDLSISITVTTTRVNTIAPRAYFMDYLRDEPGFHYDERLVLVYFANQRMVESDAGAVADALELLEVDQVCLPTVSHIRLDFLRWLGYTSATSSYTDTCLRR
ncbi:MAG TPA: DUF6077 domain-containing protein [Jiangellaceae bacterium]|nr:DUF6077 domain-containing protein [Jiangellaceae bacterium]